VVKRKENSIEVYVGNFLYCVNFFTSLTGIRIAIKLISVPEWTVLPFNMDGSPKIV
jgi:hypothetical protein